MRSRSLWSRGSGGVIVITVAIVLCAGIGVAATNVAHAAASRDRARALTLERNRAVAAQLLARRINTERTALAQTIMISPASGAADVALDAAVAVGDSLGKLDSVQVTGPNDQSVPGTLSASAHEWHSYGVLLPATSYRITAATVGRSGLTARASSTFRTVTPVGRVDATVFPADDMTVGVAQPIVVHFDQAIESDAARARVLSHLTVTESRPVPGGWHWFNDHELHFRPQQFWPSGEKVAISADLDGWDAGNGLWGEGQSHAQFTIGHSHISIADLATDKMTVSDDGHVIATYPFSGGRPTDPTMNGTHIVLDRESVVRMISSTNGVPVDSPDGYDELVYSDVHITDSGEYVHAAPWSVNSQGRTNVSHGCINLSPADALAFFGFSHVGDVVEVVAGPRPPARGDHGVMDWSTPWSQWTPAVVHQGAGT